MCIDRARIIATVEVRLVGGGQWAKENVSYGIRLYGFVELSPILGHAGHARQRVRVQDQDHECLIRGLSFAGQAVRGGALEAEARVVSRVAEHDNEGRCARAGFPTGA